MLWFEHEKAPTSMKWAIYSWDAQGDTYPHPKPELAIWRYIQGKLRAR